MLGTFVLLPGSRSVDVDLKITQTLAGENLSLLGIPMWYAITAYLPLAFVSDADLGYMKCR